MTSRALLLGVLLLAFAGPAAGSTTRGFQNDGSTCGVVRFLTQMEVPSCPRASQDGSLALEDCERPPSMECTVRVDVRAQGSGLPFTAKSILSEAYQVGRPAVAVCGAAGVGHEIECAGDAGLPVSVPEGQCRELRVRTTYRDTTEVEDGIPVVVQAAFQACRAGHAVRVS